MQGGLSAVAETALLSSIQSKKYGDALYFWVRMDSDRRNPKLQGFWSFCDSINAGNCKLASQMNPLHRSSTSWYSTWYSDFFLSKHCFTLKGLPSLRLSRECMASSMIWLFYPLCPMMAARGPWCKVGHCPLSHSLNLPCSQGTVLVLRKFEFISLVFHFFSLRLGILWEREQEKFSFALVLSDQ